MSARDKPEGRVRAHRSRRPRPAPRRREPAFRRIVGDFIANPVAVFGLLLLGLVLFLALFAPLLSPQNPYDLAQLDVMDSRLPPGSAAPAGGTYWLGTDDQGRDMLSAIFYGLRISLAVGVISHGAGADDRSRDGTRRRVRRRPGRNADHAHRRHPAVVSGDPDRADPDRRPGAGDRQGDRRAGHDPVGLLRADGAQRCAGREAQGIHGGCALPCAFAGAHRVPAPAAQLPAADDRRGDGAGGGGDRAGSDIVVPGAWTADHRALARPADCQRLPVPAFGQVLDQLLSRGSRCCARSSASTSSPISCATC